MITYESLYRSGVGKRLLDPAYNCDVFVSAFNLSYRVKTTFAEVNASHKFWVVHNEYGFSASELPNSAPLLKSSASNEADFIIEMMDGISHLINKSCRLCVDITGFMRPHLMFLMRLLQASGIPSFDFIYSEPSQYFLKADTVFSSEVIDVRQVSGFEGVHSSENLDDFLVVGAGYDHDLISHVIASKSSAKLVQLLCLPSLSADMYQESLIRLHRVADAPVKSPDELLGYASANDPYVTYMALEKILRRVMQLHKNAPPNLYLSPLATKPQAVGFALFYLNYLTSSPASIILPISRKYSKETSTGIGRRWLYQIDLPPNASP